MAQPDYDPDSPMPVKRSRYLTESEEEEETAEELPEELQVSALPVLALDPLLA